MSAKIYINASSAISALGNDLDSIVNNITQNNTTLSSIDKHPVYNLNKDAESALNVFLNKHTKYKKLDKTVQLSMLTAHQVFIEAGIISDHVGINIGSSRGANEKWEDDYQYFENKGKTRLLTSPLTTLGNISSNVAKHLEVQGPCISHSITCSTSLQAFANAYAWIKADLLDTFIVGGTEAANSLFTIKQMEALKIYSKSNHPKYASTPFIANNKLNTMTLGEGAASFVVSNKKKNAIAEIAGIGYQVDTASSLTGIPDDGENLYKSMQMAVKEQEKVDLIICHAPGTVKGDAAELKAIDRLFKQIPALYSTKHITGHTLGASGALSAYFATLILNNKVNVSFPYETRLPKLPSNIKSVLINAVGFGGNASSILLKSI